MDHSQSAPVLNDSDYYVPCHGVGDTGHEKRVLQGKQSKDTGLYSSRINQIIRQAEKSPGPGKYVAHTDWALNGGSKFSKGSRDYKPMHKNPASNTYEVKEIMDNPTIGSKDCLSTNPRILHGKVPKGKLRSFLDGAERHGKSVPAPGHVTVMQVNCDRMDFPVPKVLDWKETAKKNKSPKPAVKDLAPNHYNPNHGSSEARSLVYSVPKGKSNNFLDKAVQEKWADRRNKKEIPGPASYEIQNFDMRKVSRGTYHCQIRGLSRSPASGYF